ncbi:hypothetical protein [Sorangium sp. So ce1024]|uniref:hypothetical protein n=1 Tax=Sorangium sp. So ce1024 TaxID=3133327 RepID=UPI003EFF33F0
MSDEHETELVRQFRELAGAPAGVDVFDFHVRGCPIRATYTGGSVSSLTLTSPYLRAAPAPAPGAPAPRPPAGAPVVVRPMDIALRPEGKADRSAKEKGIAREVQTGDAMFDREVYIDSPSDEPVIRHVLASPELRAGVRALLAEGITQVRIDDAEAKTSALLVEFVRPGAGPDRARRLLDAFAGVVCNLPPVVSSPVVRPPDEQRRWLIAGAYLSGFLLCFGIPPYFVAAGPRCESNPGASSLFSLDGCYTPVPLGIVAGLAVGLPLSAAVSRRFHGRSNSADRTFWARLLTVVITIQLAIGVFAAILWLR